MTIPKTRNHSGHTRDEVYIYIYVYQCANHAMRATSIRHPKSFSKQNIFKTYVEFTTPKSLWSGGSTSHGEWAGVELLEDRPDAVLVFDVVSRVNSPPFEITSWRPFGKVKALLHANVKDEPHA